MVYYYFAAIKDGKPTMYDGTPIEIGQRYEIKGEPKLYVRGFHGSERIIDACAAWESAQDITWDTLWSDARKAVWEATRGNVQKTMKEDPYKWVEQHPVVQEVALDFAGSIIWDAKQQQYNQWLTDMVNERMKEEIG